MLVVLSRPSVRSDSVGEVGSNLIDAAHDAICAGEPRDAGGSARELSAGDDVAGGERGSLPSSIVPSGPRLKCGGGCCGCC